MLGNAWELCQDWFGGVPGWPGDGPQGAEQRQELRLVRRLPGAIGRSAGCSGASKQASCRLNGGTMPPCSRHAGAGSILG